MISEAKLSALVISLLTGVGLTLMLNGALRDLSLTLSITVPITAVMAAVLMLFASDNIKKRDEKSPDNTTAEGK